MVAIGRSISSWMMRFAFSSGPQELMVCSARTPGQTLDNCITIACIISGYGLLRVPGFQSSLTHLKNERWLPRRLPPARLFGLPEPDFAQLVFGQVHYDIAAS